MQIKDHIRQIPDFPRPGILFYDISTLLAHGPAWKATVNRSGSLAGSPERRSPGRDRIPRVPGLGAPGLSVGTRLRHGAQARQAAGQGDPLIRSRIRHRYGRDPGRRGGQGPSRRRARRSAGDRRNPGRGDRSAALGRRRGGGCGLHHRAGLPQRPRPSSTCPLNRWSATRADGQIRRLLRELSR